MLVLILRKMTDTYFCNTEEDEVSSQRYAIAKEGREQSPRLSTTLTSSLPLPAAFRSSEGVPKSKTTTVAVANFREIFFILENAVISQRKSKPERRREEGRRGEVFQAPACCAESREAVIFAAQLPSQLTFEAILCWYFVAPIPKKDIFNRRKQCS